MKYLHYVIGDIVILLALSLITNLNAATCTTTAPGVWDCGTPTGADDLIVNHDVTITSNFILTGSIIVNSGTLTFERSFTTSGTSTVVVNNGGTIIAQSNFNTRDNSEVTISGTVTVTPGNMKMFETSKVTVTGTGILNIDGSLTIGSGADTSTFIVDNGGAVTVGKGFFMDAASTGTIDGTLAVSEDFQLDGTICGTGTITYAPEAGSPKDGCSGSGTACGDSGWCDGSGIINLGALPIELLWFKAKQNGTVVELSWLTTSELNNDFFTIEKLIDLETIKVVATIKGFENSHKSVVYSAIDLLPQTGVNYYRLKQTDFDGTFSYSNIIAVNFESSTPYFRIFPNPVMSGSEINVNINGLEGAVTLFICDVSGRQVIKKFSSSVDMPQILDKHVQQLTPGIYFIKVIGSTFSTSERLIVSH